MPEGFFEAAIKERNSMTPARGYAVVRYDAFGRLGENLEHMIDVNTRVEAEAIVANYAGQGETLYILGRFDIIRELPTTEAVSIPSSLSNVDVGVVKTRWGLGNSITPSVEENYPHDDQHKENYVATGAKLDQEPSMHNEEGWVGDKAIPEWQYDVEEYKQRIQEGLRPRPVNVPPTTLGRYAKYVRTAHEDDDICASYEGSIYDLSKENKRPVPPSEGLGYTTTHPNCKCYWEPQPDFKGTAETFSLHEEQYNSHIRRLIGQRARRGSLHTTWQDGHLSKRTRKSNPMRETMIPIQEAVTGLKYQFGWFTEDYMMRLNKLKNEMGGEFFLIRASGETVTDHRSQGDQYRRLLSADEIHSMARTGIHKRTDINHHPEYTTQGIIMDADYNTATKEMEMLIHERDPEIITAVRSGIISEVSINGGLPRSQDLDCSMGECFLVPKGVVLGELDGIALTYVVTDPKGMFYHNSWIPHAEAGVKTTAIEIL